MTVAQVAKELGASRWTIRHLCADGQIPAVRRRKHWEIPTNFKKLMNQHLLATFNGVPNSAYKK
jgi:excisionase family DNA binding protein